MTLRDPALLLVLGLAAFGAGSRAQEPAPPFPRKSQHGSVSQRIARTEITIEYNRPVARGRELFGALVPWGRVWNPGADTATTIKITTPIVINGDTLAAGTYSIWTEPNATQWTIIFSRAHPVWHTPYPAGNEVLRVRAVPTKGAPMETLAFYFPMVDGRRATLVLHWGTVVVPLELSVP